MSLLFRKKPIHKILKDAAEGYGDGENLGLKKVLGVRDLTFFGMAAIIGAGIFSTVGMACFDGGPAVIFLFMGIAVACGLSALCYAEMASRLPVSGSAYTYSYATFGELIAWIIGWDLIMEYAVGNVTVAISWSGNLTTFLDQIGIHIPDFLSHGFFEAKAGFKEVESNIINGVTSSTFQTQMHELWLNAPHFMGIPLILNIPAFLITFLITYLVYIGIKESRNAANFMVIFKVLVVIAIIVIGFFYVRKGNWIPFAPNGTTGILKGVSAIFFAYIGFDALATLAEESKNPQRDLPRGMLYSLLISTVLYILIALVLTGMISYKELGNEAFLANAFISRGINFMGGIIAFSALIATASVLLVFQIGQPRIWLSMSRDGLLPKKFASIHPKFKTPSFATLVTGLLVGIPALIMDAKFVTDMCSIGTLFAFALVCGGVVVLHAKGDTLERPKFKVNFINGKFVIPLLVLIIAIYMLYTLNVPESYAYSLFINPERNSIALIPSYLFLLSLPILAFLSFKKNLSLIPMLGLLFCLYFLSTLGHINWIRFIVWLLLGLIIYFGYSRKHSKLNKD